MSTRDSGPSGPRHLHSGPRRRAGRAADEEALLAREPTGGEERVAVRDAHPLVDDRGVERVRPALLADALHEVRPLGVLRVGGEDGALRIDRDDARPRAVLLEVAADARDRAPRAHRDDDRVDVAAVRLLPELGPGRLVVRLGVRRVRVLVGLEAARDLLGEPVRDRVVALRRMRVDRGRRDDDLGAVRAQHRDLLLAHLVGHDEDAAVAAQRRRHREPGAGVARGRLDDRAAGLEAAVLLRRLDHREPDAVLHRAARVQVLELGEELARNVAGEALEPDDRRVADELEHGRVVAPRHRARSLLRSCR